MATRWPLGGFVVRVFAWLPAAFVVWYFAAPVLLWPAALLVELVAHAPGSRTSCRGVDAVRRDAELRDDAAARAPPRRRPDTITVDVNMLLYAFGLPLYAALVLAAREPQLAAPAARAGTRR